jgi:transposase InsO family protein
MCKVLKVDKSSYYNWIKQGSVVQKIDEKLNELVKIIFSQSRQTYGTRRIKKALAERYGVIVSRCRIRNILRYLGLSVKMKQRFKVMTTDSNHSLPIAPNILSRDFYASMPDKKYVGDITYIPTSEGWLYLATVIDLYSRKVVGWSMDDSMKVSLVNDALKMALSNRNPQQGLIWHTDRGSQYASYEHKNLLKQHGIVQSMSRKGNCLDNAVAESFFHTLKTELTHHELYFTKQQAKRSIFEYIEVFYNRERMHSANNNLSPVEFERRQKMLQGETAA